ncbi:MAG: undecaprenyl-phosphate glucose phosphotransferase [Methylococcales bacterium]
MRVIADFLAVTEFLLIYGIGFSIYLFYVNEAQADSVQYHSVIGLIALFLIGIFHLNNLYDLEPIADPGQQIKKIASITSGTLLGVIILLFVLKFSTNFSRFWVFSWYFVVTFVLSLERAWLYNFLVKSAISGHLTKKVVIFGVDKHADKFVSAIQNDKYPWVQIAGFFDDRLGRASSIINGQTVIGNIDTLIEFIRENRCDEVLVILPMDAQERINAVINKLRVLPVPVRLMPDIAALNFVNCKYDYFNGIPVLTILDKPLTEWDYIIKFVEDRVLAFIFLILLTPILLFIALLIKLDSPGPVLFKQKRYGYNNRLIEVYKFRSMHVNQQDNDASKLVTRNDPRVTKLGGFLRKSSLDELPQFFNVLKGEMSIVGPRPHAIKASAEGKLYEEAVAGYAERHKVKPGVTGWAQVNGWRGETDTEEKIIKRVEHDIYYIENWSLYLDLLIILRTVFVLAGQKNAY